MRNILALVACWVAMPVVAVAQTYPATKPPGGLDSTTVIPKVYADGAAGTLAQIGQMADGSVQQTEKGAKNGVAGLNENSESTSPLNTDGNLAAKAQINLGWRPQITGASVGGWPTAWWSQTPKITFGAKPPGMADDMLLFGGHGLFDGMSAKIYGVPYNNGDNSGCTFSIEMSFAPLTGATCGAGVFDAVNEFNLSSNNPPYYEAGQDIIGSDGVTHTVTFTAKSAVVTPALPADFGQIFKKAGMHVVTNVVGGDPIPSGVQNLPGPDHRSLDPQFYRGTITGYDNVPANGSTPSQTILHMADGWNLAGQSNSTHVPAPGTGTDGLDQVLYARYTHPILLIGVYLKAFGHNDRVQIYANLNDPDGTARAMAEGPARSNENNEIDMVYSGPDYGATLHGLTISGVFNNAPGSDTYALSIDGNQPTGIRDWIGPNGTDIDGDAINVGPRAAPTEAVGSTALLLNLRQQSSPYTGDGTFTDLKFYRQQDTVGYGQSVVAQHPSFPDYSVHYRAFSGGGKYTVGGSGVAAGSDFIVNPAWAKWGFAFCSGNNETSGDGTGCLTIKDDGSAVIGGGLTVANGMPYADFIPTTGSGGTPCLQATAPYELSALNKNGGYSALITGDTTVRGKLTATKINTATTGGAHFACIDDAGNFYKSDTACVK